MSSVLGNTSTSGLVASGLGSLTGLRRLNLKGNTFGRLDLATSAAALTGLTYLSMVHTDTLDWHLARTTPFLPLLTDLDMRGCTNLNLRPFNDLSPPLFLASLTALTRLDLSHTKVDDEGMEALLTPLTALTCVACDTLQLWPCFG